MSKNLILMNEMYMANLSYRFRVDFNKWYKELCRIINTDYELYYVDKYVDDDYLYAWEKAYDDKHYDILLILKKMVYMIWNCWDYIKMFPKEDLYMVLNAVNLAKREYEKIGEMNWIRYAQEISRSEEFQNLCKICTNSR